MASIIKITSGNQKKKIKSLHSTQACQDIEFNLCLRDPQNRKRAVADIAAGIEKMNLNSYYVSGVKKICSDPKKES